MTRRARAVVAALASVAAFVAAVFLRMNAAYGPFNLSADLADWTVLWELLMSGQIAGLVVAEAAALGVLAAAVPWAVLALATLRAR